MAGKRKKDSKGYYKIQRKVTPYKDKNGRIQTYKHFYGKTVKEAEAKYQAYMQGTDTELLFFGDLVNEFIEETFIPDSRYAENTKQRYIDAYRKNLEPQTITNKLIKDVSYRDIQAAYNKMTCKASGVVNCNKLLRLFFSLMVRQGIVDRDPTDGVVLPKPEKKTRDIVVFTDEELKKIETYVKRDDLPYYEQQRVNRWRFLILLAMKTGMRTSEMLALTYDDVDEKQININKQLVNKAQFKDGKTSGHKFSAEDTKTADSVRCIPMPKDLYEFFLKHKKWHSEEMLKNEYETKYIFTTSTGNFYDKHSIRHSLDRIHSDADVQCYGLHTYRRTFGTVLAKKGVKIQTLAKLMGHANIMVTAKYYVGVSTDEQVAAMEKMST